jgi:hypothetical protein
MQTAKKKNKHIGELLLPKPNYALRSKIYICSIVLFTVLISGLLSYFIFWKFIIGYILLLVPISEVVIQIINKIFSKLFKCKP